MAYCDRCERWFPHDRALEQHKEDSVSHWPCDDCHLDFKSEDTRRQHYAQSPNHHYCVECNRHFISREARIEHMGSRHSYCRAHDKTFNSEYSLQSHYRQSIDHHFCRKCECDFHGEDELWKHTEEDHHACRQCHELFDHYDELKEHDLDEHTYCTDCKRPFQNETNLFHHLSTKHQQSATVRCPDRACNRAFFSHRALMRHLKSGTCPSRMAGMHLNHVILGADPDDYITDPERMLSSARRRYETPPPAESWATERSWNGEAYECFLCRATFDTLGRLNRHLQSPRHDEHTYWCPKPDCHAEFAMLRGLCQHVEGGSCGVRTFRRARDAMDGLTRGFDSLSV